MRLLFVARAIDNMAGGVERMIISIMNALSPGHEVFLLTWDRHRANAFYPIAAGISWYRLDIGDASVKAGLRTILARLGKVRRLVNDITPDAIVCFQGGSFRSMQLYTMGLGIPMIAAERTSPSLYDHANSRRLRFIEHQAFRFARRITIQFERYRNLYPTYLRGRMVTIPNPVQPAARQARPGTPGADGRWRLLSVGRLGYQKNFSVLIDAFAALAERLPDWDLRIVGEGEDRGKLEEQLAGLPGLKARVSLRGTTCEIAEEYAAAHLFCLPSRWEGFPNSLAEALAHGLPAVGFAGCDGVPDLIEPDQNGALATGNNDVATLANALAPLMADTRKRVALGRNAVASVAHYRPEEIFRLWEEVLRECMLSKQGVTGRSRQVRQTTLRDSSASPE
jgi:glycosyltransferase involved in cell wall biosynthesis